MGPHVIGSHCGGGIRGNIGEVAGWLPGPARPGAFRLVSYRIGCNIGIDCFLSEIRPCEGFNILNDLLDECRTSG